MRRVGLALVVLMVLAATATAQTLNDVVCSSTRVTRVSLPSATTVYGADSVTVLREDRATTRFLCRPKTGKTLPMGMACSSTRTSAVALSGTVSVYADSLTFQRSDQDVARALCRMTNPVPPPPPPPPPVPPPAPPPPPAVQIAAWWAEPRVERDTLINGQLVPFFGARDSIERCAFVQFADSAVGRFDQGGARSANCTARLAAHVARWRGLSPTQQGIVDTSYAFVRVEPSGASLTLMTYLGTLPALPLAPGWTGLQVLYSSDTLPWPRVRRHGTNGGGWRYTVLGYAVP